MDRLGNTFSGLQNAQKTKKKFVIFPFSKLSWNLFQTLLLHGYIQSFFVQKKSIIVYLKYSNNEGAIRHIQRVSSPKKRQYTSYKDVQRVFRGLGTTLLSTPQGIFSHVEASRKKLGGEVLCQIF